jgi:TetR/AcrR family transcriptional regulator, transcriptional repressor for nem operon
MPRPIEYNRKDVLRAALDVFWRDGYESTTIEKLLMAMELNRGSFYAAFGGKEGLFREVMSCYTDYQMAYISATLKGKEDPLEAITGFFNCFTVQESAEIRERGCLLFNTISELSHTRPNLAKAARKRVNVLRGYFVQRLTQAGNAEMLRKDKSIDELADHLISLAAGLRMHCKIKTDLAVIREIVDIGLGALNPLPQDQAVPLSH